MSKAVLYSPPLSVSTSHITVPLFFVSLSTAEFYSFSSACQYLPLNSLSTICQYFTLYCLFFYVTVSTAVFYSLSTVSQYYFSILNSSLITLLQ